MRKTFAAWASDRFLDESFYLLTPDVGYGVLDQFKTIPRFINTGLSEELTMNIAIGLALAGKRPYIYCIATFQIFGAFEQIRNYVVPLNLPITIIGCGRELTYKSLDYSHWATNDGASLKAIGWGCIATPNKGDMVSALDHTWRFQHPCYVRIS